MREIDCQHKGLGFDERPSAQGLYRPHLEKDACGMGFVVNIKGRKSHAIVDQALTALENMTHRGAQGSEPNSGDGAGITVQLPHAFLKKVGAVEGIELPAAGDYGAGTLFFSQDGAQRQKWERVLETIVVDEGQRFLGWRTVPTNNAELGKTAKASEPYLRQLFVGRGADTSPADPMAFERKLYLIRKRAEKEIYRESNGTGEVTLYIASLSSKTIVYKGMLLSEQVRSYYPDLSDPDMVSALALIHSRFSTNTFPSWKRAHPYRYIIHNGEINTLRGNVNWMHARQSLLSSTLFGDDLDKILPVIDPDGSDTAMFDNTLEFLVMNGRSLPHAIMMMIPEPWQKHRQMDEAKRAFYEYHSCLMEPWDGPASIGFTDGVRIGAVLDRNGLRPSRYYVTKDDLVIMASEVGVMDVPPEKVLYKGRLQPGRMFLIDTELGRIVADEEIKRQIAEAQPYRQWLDEHIVDLNALPTKKLTLAKRSHIIQGASVNGAERSAVNGHTASGSLPESLIQKQQAFGYTYEDLRIILAPMVEDGKEPLGSMGDDTPLAVLSNKPQPLYNYFRQLFAQVTNPPLDAIREALVTSTETLLGSEGNLLSPEPAHCCRIRLKSPILTNGKLDRIRFLDRPGLKAVLLPILYPVAAGEAGLEKALEAMFKAANQAIDNGANILILSDRQIDSQQGAIPALLALAGLHHFLIRHGRRSRVSLVLESGEPREVHHFAVLLGYGADAINPYLAFETIADMLQQGWVQGVDLAKAYASYVKATVKGVVKVMSKMGISTIQSYRGAQIFEAVGLHPSVIDRYFTWTPSRISGVGLDVLAEEVRRRHIHAFPERPVNGKTLPEGGRYQWREAGEPHLFSPVAIHSLQSAVRNNDYPMYQRYAQEINNRTQQLFTLRGLMEFRLAGKPVPLDEVESAESICRRFKTGAMSYGSISQEAHESLAIAMNRLGGRSNTGEGGEDPDRYRPDANGDSRNSAIKQVASGRFGVTSEYLNQAQEIQIKMAQGAKPGEGGQLPGRKVYPWIAKVRHSTPGVGLISPPPHHDIYSIEDLAQLIQDLKCANPQARINVKLVSEVGVGTVAAGVAKGKADVILISGHDGGTGASPQTSIKHAGLPWELGLAEAHQTLMLNNLRTRVTLETDGQLKTGRDVVVAALLGAEEFGFATTPLVALGCLMMRVCHLNTCPAGIATQNPELRSKFAGDPEHVIAFMRFVAQDVRQIMAQLGFRTFDEMVGRSDRLEARQAVDHWKAQGIDLSPILYQPETNSGRTCQIGQDHRLEASLDSRELIDLCQLALQEGRPVSSTLSIRNTDRVVGTMLGSHITRQYGPEGLPENTIRLHFQGSAGQSFGAFIPQGLTQVLEGDANDYIGKGLSGGKIIVYPPRGSTFIAEDNIIIGNVAFYGATAGEAYINGVAGERFCVRNSGLRAVVEGVGDHGCEYMTGGRVVVLGRTGRNFAAGMSGGIAYVLDEAGDFDQYCNPQMVWLERLEDHQEILELKGMIRLHAQQTQSQRARMILKNWDRMVCQFVKVMPKDYKRVLVTMKEMEAAGLSSEEAAMAVFAGNGRQETGT